MASPRTGGRKQDPLWEMGDTTKIEMPKPDGSGAMTKGFECGNCGLKEREEEQMRENAARCFGNAGKAQTKGRQSAFSHSSHRDHKGKASRKRKAFFISKTMEREVNKQPKFSFIRGFIE